MILTWKLPLVTEFNTATKETIAKACCDMLGFYPDEIEIKENEIEISPSLGRIKFGIHFRRLVWDVHIFQEEDFLVFRWRYFTLYIFSLLFGLIGALIFGHIVMLPVIFVAATFFSILHKFFGNKLAKNFIKHKLNKEGIL
ncbi:MAG: hypothetical protein N4A46_13350 [Schleiferiaceae bacterium]|jgi:hypothetical protein|nr:hypothetical protein [Schleiferiaceae bacterium]